jgi:hypothetical protein
MMMAASCSAAQARRGRRPVSRVRCRDSLARGLQRVQCRRAARRRPHVRPFRRQHQCDRVAEEELVSVIR